MASVFIGSFIILTKIKMGLVFAEITLINDDDIALAKRHIIGEEEIKNMTVTMAVIAALA